MNETPIQLDDREAERVQNLLCENLAQSRAGLADYHHNIDVYRNYMLDEMPGSVEMFPGASNINFPYVKRTIFVLGAQILPNLLNITPMLHWEDPDARYRPAADAWEDYIQDMLILDPDSPFKCDFRKGFVNACRDSATIWHLIWDFDELETWGWTDETQDVYNDAGQLSGQEQVRRPGRVIDTTWEGPRAEAIDIKRFGTFPTSNAGVRYSSGLWMQRPVTLSTLLKGMRHGTFSKPAVLKIVDSLISNSDAGSPGDTQQSIATTQAVVGDPRKDGRAQELLLTEVLYRYAPSINAPDADWQFIIDEGTNTLLCARPAPYWLRKGRRNFISFSPFLGTGEIYGDSVASSGGAHIQKAKSDLINLAINIGRRRVNPRRAIPKSLHQELSKTRRKEFLKDGADVPYPDAMFQQGSNFAAMMLDQGADPLIVLPILQYLDLDGDRVMGVSDTDRNANLPNETATGIATRSAAKAQLSGMVREHAAEALQDMAEIMFDMVRQHQYRPVVQERWETICASRQVNIPLEIVLERPLRVEANGLTRSNDEASRAQEGMAEFGIVSKEPRVMGNERRRHGAVSRALQKVTKERFPDDILGTADEWEQEKQQELQQQQQQMEMQARASQQTQQLQQQEGERKGQFDLAKLALEARKAGIG